MLASAGEDGTVRLWQRNELEPAVIIQHPGRVFCLAYSTGADLERLATGCEDGALRVFDEQGQRVETFHGHRGQVNALSWNRRSADQWNIASAGADGTVRLWRLSKPLERSQSAVRTQSSVFAASGGKILGD